MEHEGAHERRVAAEAENRPRRQTTIHPELPVVHEVGCKWKGGGWEVNNGDEGTRSQM